jgi:hypothetical protein
MIRQREEKVVSQKIRWNISFEDVLFVSLRNPTYKKIEPKEKDKRSYVYFIIENHH